ncbi:MAG: hypothetical protein JO060_00015 [Candidatus Eremiobacteraeota bacterium]|nr:hypothetical protein [Candidatus Eremiobacteraeota bacterium]
MKTHWTTAFVTTCLVAGAFAVFAGHARAANEVSDLIYICHPVASGETVNAKMTATSGASLSCRVVSMKLKMSDGSMRTIGRVTAESHGGPDLSNALTPGQVNDAWVKWLDDMFHVTHTP